MKEVILTVHCQGMTEPKIQRLKFDETLSENGWFLVTHSDASKNGSKVSTTTKWQQDFLDDKPQAKIEKQIKNLLKRAATYAEITNISASYLYEGVTYSI